MTMLQSRLQAFCENVGVSYEERDTNAVLAKRIQASGRWNVFVEKYSVDFVNGEFLDLRNLAYVQAVSKVESSSQDNGLDNQGSNSYNRD